MDTQAKKQSILIVEDDIPELNALRDKLTREGFATLEAKNGEEGLATALSQHPDLILLDIIMPVMDGMTMLKKLRAETEWGKTAKVIMLTNLSDNKMVANAIEQGSHEYLVKCDWKIEDVVAKIRERLNE